MPRLLAALLFLAVSFNAAAAPTEREAVLAALRPTAERMAGQPVKFQLTQLNIDDQWALATGSLVRPDGGEVDWSLAQKRLDCDTSEDKGFFAVVHKVDGAWAIKEIDVCDPEPRYWTMDELEKVGFPCDLLRGLENGAEQTPLEQCKALRRGKKKR